MFKNFVADIKADAAEEAGEGLFIAYASVFGNIDSYGDVVQKGAFANTLAKWEESGNPIPVYFGHRMDDLQYNIGHIISAEEDEHGLKVTGKLDLELENGKLAYHLLKQKRLTQLSFAYDVVRAEAGEQDGQKVMNLFELDIHEVSIVPVGANRETEFLEIKAAAVEVKEGRVLAQKHIEDLRTAYEHLGKVLEATTVEKPKSLEDGLQAKDEALSGKSEEPTLDQQLDKAKLEIEIASLRGDFL